jgi:hypothetical protein
VWVLGVNVIVVCLVVFRRVTDSDMSVDVVPGANIQDVRAVGKTDGCDIGGCPTGLGCPNDATRSCEVGENVDHGGRGCPTDFLCASGVRTGRAGRIQSTGWVREALWCTRCRAGCVCTGCHVTIELGDGGFEQRTNGLWRDEAVRRRRRGLGVCSG